MFHWTYFRKIKIFPWNLLSTDCKKYGKLSSYSKVIFIRNISFETEVKRSIGKCKKNLLSVLNSHLSAFGTYFPISQGTFWYFWFLTFFDTSFFLIWDASTLIEICERFMVRMTYTKRVRKLILVKKTNQLPPYSQYVSTSLFQPTNKTVKIDGENSEVCACCWTLC